MSSLALVADIEPVVAGQPRNGALDHPPVSAQALGGLDSLAGDTNSDSPVTNPSAQFSGIVCLIGMQLARSAPPRSAS